MREAPCEWAWCDGRLVRHAALTIHAESLAMRYALSAFEGIRAYLQHDGRTVRCFALDEHAARLDDTLRIVGLPPLEAGSVTRAAAHLLDANTPAGDCYLRVAVNATSLGVLTSEPRTALFASLQPMARRPWLAAGVPLAVAISARRKPSDDVFPQRAKVIANYAGPRLAFLEARRAGFDDVVLTTAEGLLSEAPTANLFVVHADRLSTPRLCDGILPGITRHYVIGIAREQGWQVEERAIAPGDAHAASDAFLCGTGVEFARIASFDRRELPGGSGLLSHIVDRYFDLVRGGRPLGAAPVCSSSSVHAG